MGLMLHRYETNNILYEDYYLYDKYLGKDVRYRAYKPEYAGGRIDCCVDYTTDPDYDPYGPELRLDIMDVESYSKFSDWLETAEELYELDTGDKLNIWEE